MTNDTSWIDVGYGMARGIAACSDSVGSSPTDALEKIDRGVAMAKELLPHEPKELQKKIGEHMSAAILAGKPDAVARLLKLGADIELRTASGLTPLQQATLTGRVDIMKMLVDAGAALDSRIGSGPHGPGTALHLAIARRSVPALGALVAAGAKINAIESERTQNTALHLASQCAHVNGNATETQRLVAADLVQILIDAGADVARRNRAGDSPLLLAISAKNRPAYMALFDAGGYSADELFETVERAIRDDVLHAIEVAAALGADLTRKVTVMGKQYTLSEHAQKRGATHIVTLLDWLAANKETSPEVARAEADSILRVQTLDSCGPL
jgi:hypothetical protein